MRAHKNAMEVSFAGVKTKQDRSETEPLLATEDPTLVSGFGGPIRQLAAGHNFTCGLREDGQVLCFGKNEYGALGKDIQTAFRVRLCDPTWVKKMWRCLPPKISSVRRSSTGMVCMGWLHRTPNGLRPRLRSLSNGFPASFPPCRLVPVIPARYRNRDRCTVTGNAGCDEASR